MAFSPIRAVAGEALRVGKSNANAFAYMPLDVGVQKGIFNKHGLDVEIVNFGRAPMLDMALTGGTVDIGLTSGVELALIEKGLPVKGVAAILGAPVELTFSVVPDSPIKTVADLKGKSVAVSQIASMTGWVVAQLSQQQGWGPEGIKRATIGPPDGYWAALMTKQIDAASVDISSALQAERLGRGRILITGGDVVKSFVANLVFATNTLMEKNPRVIRSFLTAWFETVGFMRADKAATIAIAKEVQHVDADIAAGTYDIVMKEVSNDGRFSNTALDELRQTFIDLHVLDNPPDMKTLVTEKYLPPVAGKSAP